MDNAVGDDEPGTAQTHSSSLHGHPNPAGSSEPVTLLHDGLDTDTGNEVTEPALALSD
jgi:hypothetical protein